MANSSAETKRKLRHELESWHQSHGYELALMLEEKPHLFRSLLKNPGDFNEYELGKRFSRLVRSTVDRVEKSPAYRKSFLETRTLTQAKDSLSIGRIISRGVKKRKK